MPTYEFICKECGQEFEEQRKIEDFDAKCPLCGSDTDKLMSAPGIKTSNPSADSAIGADAERRWADIEERRSKRTKEYFGSETDVKAKDQQRLDTVLNKQNAAYGVIDKAKQEAGITKKDEMNHLLKG